MPQTIDKDPQAVLPYSFDWIGLGWLPAGESIATYTLTADPALTIESDSLAANVVTAVVSGGVRRQTHKLRCHIVTSPGGLEDDRTIYLKMNDR